MMWHSHQQSRTGCQANGAGKVLLVDDEPRLLQSLHALLAHCDLAISSASTGGEAIEHLTAQPYDLIILDLHLPDITGHDVMDFMNQNGHQASVVVTSGDTDIGAAIGAIKRGAYDYLRKPYAPEELLKTVENALAQRRLRMENQRIAGNLEISERKYRWLVDHSPDIIFSLDGQGQVTYVNRRVQSLLNRETEDFVGSDFASLVHPEDSALADLVQVSENQLQNSSSVEVRLHSRHGEGEWRHFWVELSRDRTAFKDHMVAANDAAMVLGIARDITDRKRADELITHQAYYDMLTDLPNRALLRDRLGLALLQAKRNDSKLTVMFLDLDRFKLVNDTLGHSAGDQLLQQVTARMRACLRAGDTLARIGGDEFMVITPDLGDRKDAAQLAAKFHASLKAPVELATDVAHVSVSIGIAIYPDDGETIDELITSADIAMYHVKSGGKNGYRFFDRHMLDASNARIALESSLRSALDRGELVMHYQPQVDVRTGGIVGAEALMRWHHPQRGLLPAKEFLSITEENGLIFPLTEWLVDMVCKDVKICQAQVGRAPRISLNLSPRSLDRGNFFEVFSRTVKAQGVDPALFEVELTESFCIHDTQTAIDQLHRLCALGVTVAIDDFGTGFSSLSYLHRFPVQTIKIDRSFVTEIQRDRRPHWPVVLAIISIAKGLNLHLVAEGVESRFQADYLAEAGCNVMQGYLFHRPMPLQEFIGLLGTPRKA